jgi:hypothetical protein
MYIQNRRNISKFNSCSPLQNRNGLISLKPSIAYFAYTFRYKLTVIVFLASIQIVNCQPDTVSLQLISNYNSWGWDALVIKNNLITASFVPSMGGNMLQYDFGTDTFLILNSLLFGQEFDPYQNQSPFESNWGFGGFQIWPTPETWPPPPVLTWGNYSDSVLYNSPDSLSLILKSEIEIESTPGLKFIKSISATSYSTGIKIENKIINCNQNPVKYGMMNVAETMVQHQQEGDFSNFKVYFPVEEEGLGVRFSPNSVAFKGEVMPRVFEVEYSPQRGKVFADVPFGWIAYIDERDKQAYFCLYEIESGSEYPDLGANLEIYVESQPNFIALEAISPLKTLSSDSGVYSFSEYFYSSQLTGPILKVNHAGAVSQRLFYDSINSKLSGIFGVFYEGDVMFNYYDSKNNLLGNSVKWPVSPSKTVSFDEALALPLNTHRMELVAFNYFGLETGILDYFDFSESITTGNNLPIFYSSFNLVKNIIVLNGEVEYTINLSRKSFVSLKVFNQNGQIVGNIYDDYLEVGNHFSSINLQGLSGGVYFISFTSEFFARTEKIVVY